MKKIIIAAFFTLCSISSFASINEFFECLLEESVGTKDYTSVKKTYERFKINDVLELYGIILDISNGNDSIENELIAEVICKVEESTKSEGGVRLGIGLAKRMCLVDYHSKINNIKYVRNLKEFLSIDTIRTLEDVQEFYKNYEVKIEIEKPQETIGDILRRAYKSNGAE